MLLFHIRSLIGRYVERGLQPDSLRRQLNRQGISTTGLNFAGIAREVIAEKANEQQLVGRRSDLRPRPGRDMVATTFRIPAAHRYAVEVTYRDPLSGDTVESVRSVYSNDALTLGQAASLARLEALRGLQSPRGASDPFAPFEVADARVVNAYYNAGEEAGF